MPEALAETRLKPTWRWQRMLDGDIYTSVSEIGDAENISKSYVRRSNRAWALSMHRLAQCLLCAAFVRRSSRPARRGWSHLLLASGRRETSLVLGRHLVWGVAPPVATFNHSSLPLAPGRALRAARAELRTFAAFAAAGSGPASSASAPEPWMPPTNKPYWEQLQNQDTSSLLRAIIALLSMCSRLRRCPMAPPL
jgi:hypothetical protein